MMVIDPTKPENEKATLLPNFQAFGAGSNPDAVSWTMALFAQAGAGLSLTHVHQFRQHENTSLRSVRVSPEGVAWITSY